MELALFVWLASILPGISAMCGVIALVLAGYCAIKVIVAALNHTNYEREYKPEIYKSSGEILRLKWFKWPAITIVFFIVTSVAIPSQKTMYLMLGAYMGQSLVQSETADKVIKIMNGKLDEYLKEAETQLKREKK